MTVRRLGKSTLRTKDRTQSVLSLLQRRKEVAARAMAMEVKRQAQGVFSSDGDGSWEPNSQATVEWKGHEKVMLGRTGALSDGIEMRPVTPSRYQIGWFGDDHPDSDLTMGRLAWEHEKDRPWLSKVADNPVRAEAVFAGGKTAYLRAGISAYTREA